MTWHIEKGTYILQVGKYNEDKESMATAGQRRVRGLKCPAINVGIILTFKTNSFIEGLNLKIKRQNNFL